MCSNICHTAHVLFDLSNMTGKIPDAWSHVTTNHNILFTQKLQTHLTACYSVFDHLAIHHPLSSCINGRFHTANVLLLHNSNLTWSTHIMTANTPLVSSDLMGWYNHYIQFCNLDSLSRLVVKPCQQYVACAIVKNNKPFIQCSSYPIYRGCLQWIFKE